jgi:hypothetical protein
VNEALLRKYGDTWIRPSHLTSVHLTSIFKFPTMEVSSIFTTEKYIIE